MEGWRNLVELAKWPRGDFLSGCLFPTVFGEGKGTYPCRIRFSDFYIFLSDPEWCWMEAGPAFTLSFPDTSATASCHLLPDDSCPAHSMFHRPSINWILTFSTTPLRTWNSLTSNIKTINSSGVVFPLTGPLSNSPQKVPAQTEVDVSPGQICRDRRVCFLLLPGAWTLLRNLRRATQLVTEPGICSDFAGPWFFVVLWKMLRNVSQLRKWL